MNGVCEPESRRLPSSRSREASPSRVRARASMKRASDLTQRLQATAESRDLRGAPSLKRGLVAIRRRA